MSGPITTKLSEPDAPQLWPEALRDRPRDPDPFPWRQVGRWMLPGLIVALVLFSVYAYLEQRAAKQIAYVQSERLLFMRSDNRSSITADQISKVVGRPQWAPDGSSLAVVSGNNIKKLSLLLPSAMVTTSNTFSRV